jgi:DtxR family manganese transport transcriptional regulator
VPRRAAPRPPIPAAESARFSRTRAAHRDETAEDYAEAIEQITASAGVTRVRDLATLMGVSHVTVSKIVARLSRDGLVRAEPYRSIGLTPAGRRLAARVRRRHEVVLGFLHALGVPDRQAQIDAEGIEHHVSEATIRAMRRAGERLRRG